MVEWYEAGETQRTARLYDHVRSWAQPRHDVTVIGGVAVWELVKPAYRMRSRDIDKSATSINSWIPNGVCSEENSRERAPAGGLA